MFGARRRPLAGLGPVTLRQVLFAAVATDRSGWTWLSVTGECDLASIVEFRAELRRATRAGHPVVVDLTGLSLLDSLGVGLLIGAARRATQLVVLAPPGSRAREVLDATGVSGILDVRDAAPGG